MVRSRCIGVRFFSAALVAVVLCACAREKPTAVPVVIISIDTLRADRLPAYGYRGVDTPAIDALRNDSVLFANAYAHVPLTLPSHTSLFTGLLPARHGVRDNLGYTLDAKRHRTIATLLKDRGYATGAAVSAFVLRSTTGINAGFDFFDDAIAARGGGAAGNLARSGEATLASSQRWLSSHAASPFFFFFHIFEPHAPYAPPEPFASQVRDAYDGEIAAADHLVGRFIRTLKDKGVYDRALIILLSDHGEGLNQHGEAEHGVFLYREAIRVPLMVKLPAQERAGQTVDAPVGLIDVAPTVASIVGIDDIDFDGASLLDGPSAGREIYAESYYGRIHLGWSELRSLVTDRLHFIEAPRPELYDVIADPAEKHNLVAVERRDAARLGRALAAIEESFETPGTVSNEDAAKLTALGYLGSSRAAAAGPLPDPKDHIHQLATLVVAQRLASEGRTAEAIAELRKLLETSPRSTDARIQLAQLLDADGRIEEAAREYRTVLATTPELAGEVGGTLGTVLLKLGDLDAAAAHARLAERTNPAGMHLLLARIELARGNLDRAESGVRAAMAFASAGHDAKLLAAQILVQRGRLAEALAALQSLDDEMQRAGAPPLRGLHFLRGDVLARLERPSEAIAAFEQEIELFPAARDAWARLTLVHLLLGDREKAHATLERMVELSPTKEAHLFAARTLEELDDPAGARQWRRRAAAIR